MSQLPAIQIQISRYTDAVNSRNWAAFPNIFAKDASWEAIGLDIRFDGLDAITSGLSKIVTGMSRFVQMNTPAVIELDGDRASARSTIYEIGESESQGSWFEAYGRYEDELVRHNGVWLFQSRRFVRLIRKEGPLGG
jgi:hypothetical protein